MIFRGRFRSRILILFVLVLLIFYYLDNLVTLFKDFNSKSPLDQSPSSHKSSHFDKPQGKSNHSMINPPFCTILLWIQCIVQMLNRKPRKSYLILTNCFKNIFNALDIIQEQSKISSSLKVEHVPDIP